MLSAVSSFCHALPASLQLLLTRRPAQLSQCGQDSGRAANAHCAQSGFTQGESASQHFHCRESHIAAAAGMRDN